MHRNIRRLAGAITAVVLATTVQGLGSTLRAHAYPIDGCHAVAPASCSYTVQLTGLDTYTAEGAWAISVYDPWDGSTTYYSSVLGSRAGTFHVITDDIVTGTPGPNGVLDIGPNGVQAVKTGMLPEPGNVQQVLDAEYVPNPTVVAQKNTNATKLQTSVSLHLAQYATQAPASATFTGVIPATSALGEGEPQSVALGILLYRQEPNFCGPDSTAIVTMMDNQADYGFNFQYTIARDMGYQDNGPQNYPGTSYPSVQKWLNHYTNIVYNAQKPSDTTQLMSWIVSDTWNYGNTGLGLVNDVQPEKFDFWQGYTSAQGHYDVTRGYDERGGGYAQIGEEFDPSYRNGKRPYGFHLTAITDLYNAIAASPAPVEIW